MRSSIVASKLIEREAPSSRRWSDPCPCAASDDGVTDHEHEADHDRCDTDEHGR